jgi:hypothetical protein
VRWLHFTWPEVALAVVLFVGLYWFDLLQPPSSWAGWAGLAIGIVAGKALMHYAFDRDAA